MNDVKIRDANLIYTIKCNYGRGYKVIAVFEHIGDRDNCLGYLQEIHEDCDFRAGIKQQENS